MSRFDIGKILNAAASKGAPLALGLGGLAGAGYIVKNATYTVTPGHMALKYNRLSGVGNETRSDGLNFLIPWLERPIIFDIKAKPTSITSLTGSKDLQMVNISLRVLGRPNPKKLPEIYRTLGLDQQEVVFPSIINEVLKSVIAQYNASSLITQRELVSRMIRTRLVERARDFHIELDDVALTHINFSVEYEKAVESKQVAQQQAERAKFLVLKAQEVKKTTIINAEGEKVSAEMIGKAIKDNPGFIELRRIEVAKQVAQMLAKSSNRMVLSSDSLLLNLVEGKDLSSEGGSQEPSKPAAKKK
jgi:prohibitin 2